MAKKYQLYQIDSFTKERFRGNPAGVVINAQGLSDLMMQKIARELNNSETAFIFHNGTEDHDVTIRYFTPTSEVPICGHATIAAHYALAKERNLSTTRIVQKCGAGMLPIDIVKNVDDYKITMTQGKVEFGTYINGIQKKELISALGLCDDELEDNCPIQIVSTGHSKVMIGIKENDKLDKLQPNYSALSVLSKNIGCNGYYVFTIDPNNDTLIRGRMFAPAIGINEDPVTGNANGPLGAYLVHHKIVGYNDNKLTFKAIQGEAMGRPGIIEVEVSIEENEPHRVRISGEAVIVFKTELIV